MERKIRFRRHIKFNTRWLVGLGKSIMYPMPLSSWTPVLTVVRPFP